MSIEAIAWASRLKLPPREKFVLVALCDHHNRDEQAAWMKQSTLAEWTGYSRATVNAALVALEDEHGLIKSETRRYADGRNASKIYRLNLTANSVKEVDTAPARVNEIDPVRVNRVDSVRVNQLDNKNLELRTVNLEPSSSSDDDVEFGLTANQQVDAKLGSSRKQNLSHLSTFHKTAFLALVDLKRVHSKPVNEAQFQVWSSTVLEDVRAFGQEAVVQALTVTIERAASLDAPFAYYRKIVRNPKPPDAPAAEPFDPLDEMIAAAKAGSL